MTSIEANARLHFGLLSLPFGDSPLPGERRYGGVGLMVERPNTSLTVSPAETWSAEGPNSARALRFGQQFVEALPVELRQPFAIVIKELPPEHAGLGSGTALALACARAIAVESGLADWPAAELAIPLGRGLRSAVGIHGFAHGGLIVEGGKLPGQCVSPLVGHFEFPAEWPVVLLIPNVEPCWHGRRERDAFRCVGSANSTDALCRLVLTGLLPALVTRDFDAFSDALHEYNVRAGEGFFEQQGGIYSSRQSTEIVDLLRRSGKRGTGQSSWGPTLFAIAKSQDDAEQIRYIARQSVVPLQSIIITRAASAGARVGRAVTS